MMLLGYASYEKSKSILKEKLNTTTEQYVDMADTWLNEFLGGAEDRYYYYLITPALKKLVMCLIRLMLTNC